VKYVLDTNAVSALMQGQEVAVRRLLALSRSEVALPEPVAAEIAYGMARLPHSRKRSALEARFALVRDELSAVPWTAEVSVHFGRVKAALEKRGALIEDFDIAIAAHALAYGSVLVTANGKHMRRIAGLLVEDWTLDK
jgi:tRNA(fMet)-specific endonuclease VapC